MKNGVEVKLQRNALSVLEPPTGNEDDDDHDFDNSSCSSDMGEKDNDFCEFQVLNPNSLEVVRTLMAIILMFLLFLLLQPVALGSTN